VDLGCRQLLESRDVELVGERVDPRVPEELAAIVIYRGEGRVFF
jgi:hypothetical protein